MMLRNETYNAMLFPPPLCYFLPAMLFPPRYAIPSPLCFFLPAMLFPSCYAIPLCYAISSHYTLCRCYSHIITTSQYGYFVMSYTKTSQYIRNFSIVNSRKPPFEKLRSLQSALLGRNDYTDQPRTPHRRAQRDRQDRRDFSGGSQFRQLSRSCSPHRSAPSRVFSKRRTSPPPYHQANSSFHSPSRQPYFFGRAQTPRVPQSAPYAWDETSAKSANAAQKTSGTAQRSGVERTSKGGLLL